MLPLFATLLFALIGIGALVIDAGLALAEQARLETAAEMMVSRLCMQLLQQRHRLFRQARNGAQSQSASPA